MRIGGAKYPVLAYFLFVAVGAAAGPADSGKEAAPVVVKTILPSIHAHGLPHLIEVAEQNSPVIQAAKNTLQVARLEYENASRQWLPSVDVVATHGYQGQRPSISPTPFQSQLDLTATEHLYDNGSSLTNYRIAKLKRERSQIEFEIARDKQLLAVANDFYDWSAALQQKEIVQNNRDLLKRQYQVLDSQYRQGIKTKKDVLRIETEMRRIELDVLTAANDVDNAYQKLAAAVGVSRQDLAKEDISPEEAKPYVTSEMKTPDLTAATSRESQVVDFQKKEAELSTSLVRRKYWPQVDLSGGLGYHNLQYLDNPAANWETNQYWGWSALVTLTYNLWDFGVRRRQVQIAHINEMNVGHTGDQTLLDLDSDLRSVMLQLRTLKENVRMTRELLGLEQQSYSILESEYRSGRSTYLDLVTELRSLIDARSKFSASYFGLKKQLVLYSFHKGDLYESLRQE